VSVPVIQVQPAPPGETAAGGDPGRRSAGGVSPARAFLAVTLTILATEILSTLMLGPAFYPSGPIELLIDAGALLTVVMPIMYLVFVRPMARAIQEKSLAEDQLREVCEGLERTVHARTQELETVNRSLREEAMERTRADARSQLQGRLLDVVQQAVIATGKGGVIVYWNRYAEWMFGWTEQEVRGETLSKVTSFSAEAARHGLAGFGAVKGWTGEVRAVRREGGTFPAYLTCSPIWRPDGSVAGFVYTFMDITERKAAEEAIRDSEEKYSTVVESSPTGIFIYSEGKILFGNQRFFTMVGRSPGEFRGFDAAEIIHPDDWPMVLEIWRRRFNGSGGIEDYDCRILTSKGDIRWVSGRTTLIRYRGGLALLGNIQDITERHKAEQALRDSREALHRLSARLLAAQENERQRVARELHDSIGQSLSAIKFMVERALDGDGTGDHGPRLTALRSAVPVIQASVEEVRRISMALRPSTLDDLGLMATLAWFSREFQATYPHIQVERVMEVEESEIPEPLKTTIFRIVQEAMNNAAKHSQASRITVALRILFGSLQLVVADNGVGFKPGAPRREDAAGGFGLAFMRERAELFGGALVLTSGIGLGTEITAQWALPEMPTA